MYAITNKSGLNSSLFNNLNLLFDELSKLAYFYKLDIPNYDDFNKVIDDNGYYQINFYSNTYYVIKTTVDCNVNIINNHY